MSLCTYTQLGRKLAVTLAIALLLTFVAVPAGAADADQTATQQSQAKADEKPEAESSKEPQKLEALKPLVVTTTGSRLQQAVGQVELGPIVSVDAEELLHQGTVRVEELVRSLPSVFTGGQDASNANGASGIATLNLRHLGSSRTLVLINGRRMPAGSPWGGTGNEDINQIPGALLKRVDVLTGGSSVTYGSDAVAGVINFILIDDFEGIKLDYQFSQHQHDNDNRRLKRLISDQGYEVADDATADGELSNVSLILGKNLGGNRGNITAYATWRDGGKVLRGDRDHASCDLAPDGSDRCIGSGTIPKGLFADFGTHKSGPGHDPGLPFFYQVEGDKFTNWDGRFYNYAPVNHYQRPDVRWTAGAFAHYDLHESVEAYTELMFTDDRTTAQIAPSGSFFRTRSLHCGNAFLSEQQFQALCGQYGLTREDIQNVYIGRRSVESGNRKNYLHHTSYRGVFGLRGEIADTWRYNLYYQYAEVRALSKNVNGLSASRINRALDAVYDPVSGDIVCRSALSGADPSCVPWNIFQDGAVTKDMTDYIAGTYTTRGSTNQHVLSGQIAANLGRYGLVSPFATTGVDIALGVEWREENLKYKPDLGSQSGDGAGFGGARQPLKGGFDVPAVFFEAGIPLIQDVPFIQQLIVNGGYRSSWYGVQTDTYGVRAGWAINYDISLRGSYQRAVRAPSIREQFLPQRLGLTYMATDPCAGEVVDGKTAAGRSFEECARSGVTAEQFGNISDSPARQYNFLIGGNPDLLPEDADTYSFGLTFTPRFLEGLTIAMDYYDIELKGGVGALSPELVLNHCLDGKTSQCDKVKRGPGGDLWLSSNTIETTGHIEAVLENLAIAKVRGYDFSVDYVLNLGRYGSVSFTDRLSFLDTFNVQAAADIPKIACAGSWGQSCGTPTPSIRNILRTTWRSPWGLQPSLMWRYISTSTETDPDRPIPVNARHYFDLSLLWEVNQYASLRLGVRNLFDKEPPIVGDSRGGNTFPGLYDALGRYWFVGMSVGIS